MKRGERPAPPLLHGPYRATQCKAGDWIDDELLGLVQVFGWTEGRPIAWPRLKQKGPPSPVLTAELARAVRTESELAVAHWWGVSVALVQRWRRELGVGRCTEGTRHALRQNVESLTADERAGRYAALTTPEARARSAAATAARKGKPAHPETRAALLRGARKPKPAGWAARANAWMLAGKAKRKRPKV